MGERITATFTFQVIRDVSTDFERHKCDLCPFDEECAMLYGGDTDTCPVTTEK